MKNARDYNCPSTIPPSLKFSKTVDSFKNNLSKFKKEHFLLPGHFWELSNEIFNRIPENNRDEYVLYAQNNPEFSKRRGINTRVSMS